MGHTPSASIRPSKRHNTKNSVAAGHTEVAENEVSVVHRISSRSVPAGGALPTAETEDVDILLQKNLSGGGLNIIS